MSKLGIADLAIMDAHLVKAGHEVFLNTRSQVPECRTWTIRR
jgi:hypothetical protein